MKVEEYISSGVLELYVLNMLSEEEVHEVEQMMKTHNAVADEVESIRSTMESYATAHAEAPSEHVKEQLFQKLEFSDNAELKPTTKVYFLRWFAAAASVLLIISIGLNLYQIQKIKEVEGSLAQLKQDQNVLAEENGAIKAKLSETEERVQLYQNPDIQNVLIKGSDLSPESYAYVSYNKQNNSISLSAINLPEEGESHSYQLWALVDGKPVDLGVFDSNDSLIKIEKAVPNAGAFAVTLQDKGGNPTPNLEQLYLIGNV